MQIAKLSRAARHGLCDETLFCSLFFLALACLVLAVSSLLVADKVFEGTDPAGSWLAHPAYGLGGKIPVLHARTRKGKAAVMTLMNRIEYGVLCKWPKGE